MPDFTLKRGDTRPAIDIPIDRGGTPVPLASTVAWPYTPSRILLLTKPESGTGNGIAGTMTIPSAAGGVTRYTWQGNDTATVGLYNMEVEVQWSDGGVETFPEDAYLSLDIKQDLGGA